MVPLERTHEAPPKKAGLAVTPFQQVPNKQPLLCSLGWSSFILTCATGFRAPRRNPGWSQLGILTLRTFAKTFFPVRSQLQILGVRMQANLLGGPTIHPTTVRTSVVLCLCFRGCEWTVIAKDLTPRGSCGLSWTVPLERLQTRLGSKCWVRVQHHLQRGESRLP